MRLKKNPFFKNLRWRRLSRLVYYFRYDLRHVRGELTLALVCTLGTTLSVHTAHRTGDLVLRATGDTNMLREMLVESALIILSEFLVVFAMLGVMFWMDWQLTTVSLAVLPLMTLTAFRFSHELREAVRLQRQRDGRMASLLSEVLHAITVVQAFGRQTHEDERFADFNKRSLKQGLRAVRPEAGLA